MTQIPLLFTSSKLVVLCLRCRGYNFDKYLWLSGLYIERLYQPFQYLSKILEILIKMCPEWIMTLCIVEVHILRIILKYGVWWRAKSVLIHIVLYLHTKTMTLADFVLIHVLQCHHFLHSGFLFDYCFYTLKM